MKSTDPEEAMQERFTWWEYIIIPVAIAWAVGSGFCHLVRRWFTTKIVCAWCQPQRRMRGNPLARRVSHGICPECSRIATANHERFKRERKHGTGASRSSRIHQNRSGSAVPAHFQSQLP